MRSEDVGRQTYRSGDSPTAFLCVLRDNAKLLSLDGLKSVKSSGGLLSIKNNAALAGLGGLLALESVAEEVEVIDNPLLPNQEACQLAIKLGKACSCSGNSGPACGP